MICGVAPNSVALIVGRAIAGIGSAGIFSGALIIVAYSVPLAKRPMYTGFIGAMVSHSNSAFSHAVARSLRLEIILSSSLVSDGVMHSHRLLRTNNTLLSRLNLVTILNQ